MTSEGVNSPTAVRPVGGCLREGLVHAVEGGDHAVDGGNREGTEDGRGGDGQQQLAAFGLGALVRREQGMKPGGITKLGPGHVHHEGPRPVRGCLQQGRPQLRGVGDVDLLRCRHDRDAADYLKGAQAITHLRHLPWLRVRLRSTPLLPGAPLRLSRRAAEGA